MKSIFSILLFCIGLSSINAQVSDLKYLMKYNCETNAYDVKIKIMEGSATTPLERVQFNSQLTILVPTGMSFEILERFQPLENNQLYGGVVPNEWSIYSPIVSPIGHEKYDFYSVAPRLSPTSFFNDLAEGDEVTIFSFGVDGEQEYDDRIRFFDNAIDMELSLYGGVDLRNGYSVGGSADSYSGNIHESCVVSSTENIGDLNVKVYPNPTGSKVLIEVSDQIRSIKLIDIAGKVLAEQNYQIANNYTFDVSTLDAGIYFLQLDNGFELTTEKLMILGN